MTSREPKKRSKSPIGLPSQLHESSEHLMAQNPSWPIEDAAWNLVPLLVSPFPRAVTVNPSERNSPVFPQRTRALSLPKVGKANVKSAALVRTLPMVRPCPRNMLRSGSVPNVPLSNLTLSPRIMRNPPASFFSPSPLVATSDASVRAWLATRIVQPVSPMTASSSPRNCGAPSQMK